MDSRWRRRPCGSTLRSVAERVRQKASADRRTWRDVAAEQAGLITRTQLRQAGVERWTVTHRVTTERWQWLTSNVIATTTGELSLDQRLWLGVLHAGSGALVGELTAAERLGLQKWHRDEITILVPYANDVPAAMDGYRFVRSRRAVADLRTGSCAVPCCRLEPAILLFASTVESERTAQGVLAAAVQQRLTTPEQLGHWLVELSPLRRAPLFRRVIDEIAGGAQSLAEMDVRRFCRRYGFAPPARQVRRRDADGRVRYTDCEWRLVDGRILILEVDGAFHMDVEQWEDDLARQRAPSATDRLVVRCTAREVRDCSPGLARDLSPLGVPRAAAS